MAKSRPILQYDTEGNFVQRHGSARAAALSVGLRSHSGIIACCQLKENARQTSGFQWRYGGDDQDPEKIESARSLGEIFKARYGKGSEGYADIREKYIQSSLMRYGQDHPMKNEIVKELLKSSVLLTYGVDNVARNPEIKKKISETETETKLRIRNSKFKGIRINFCHISEVRDFLSSLIDWTGVSRNLVPDDFAEKLDIFLPSFSLGIEVNGIKFHSDAYGKGEKYHINKTKMFEEVGIQILHFFDDEIIEKPDLVMDMIRTKCGLNRRIYARKCTIKSIETPAEFLGNNHLQGNLASSVAYGLFYEGELVSSMTFGPLRKILGYKEKEGWEMLRFCNSLGVNVIGGASKLLKRFIEDHKPDQIISYANLRWSNGSLYRKLGFTEDGRTSPGYFYFWKNRRVHRYTLRKSELVKMGHDPAKTAQEIIQEIQVPKIYDCGNIRFIWNAP